MILDIMTIAYLRLKNMFEIAYVKRLEKNKNNRIFYCLINFCNN